jgi:Fe-S-cluster-containing hydrogenase component 2
MCRLRVLSDGDQVDQVVCRGCREAWPAFVVCVRRAVGLRQGYVVLVSPFARA